jgi:hypothetical protein
VLLLRCDGIVLGHATRSKAYGRQIGKPVEILRWMMISRTPSVEII